MSVPVVRHCGSWCQSWLSECERERRHVTLMTPWQTRLRVLPKLTESDSALTTLLTLPLALALAHSRPPPYIQPTLTQALSLQSHSPCSPAYIGLPPAGSPPHNLSPQTHPPYVPSSAAHPPSEPRRRQLPPLPTLLRTSRKSWPSQRPSRCVIAIRVHLRVDQPANLHCAQYQTAIAGNVITIFSKTYCPYCKRAKALLTSKFPDAQTQILEYVPRLAYRFLHPTDRTLTGSIH